MPDFKMHNAYAPLDSGGLMNRGPGLTGAWVGHKKF